MKEIKKRMIEDLSTTCILSGDEVESRSMISTSVSYVHELPDGTVEGGFPVLDVGRHYRNMLISKLHWCTRGGHYSIQCSSTAVTVKFFDFPKLSLTMPEFLP